LDSSSSSGNEPLYRCGVITSCKLLLVGFDTFDNGDSQELFINTSVKVEYNTDFFIRRRFGKMSGVALLPEELAGAEEWL
jgi:hypothetical protein